MLPDRKVDEIVKKINNIGNELRGWSMTPRQHDLLAAALHKIIVTLAVATSNTHEEEQTSYHYNVKCKIGHADYDFNQKQRVRGSEVKTLPSVSCSARGATKELAVVEEPSCTVFGTVVEMQKMLQESMAVPKEMMTAMETAEYHNRLMDDLNAKVEAKKIEDQEIARMAMEIRNEIDKEIIADIVKMMKEENEAKKVDDFSHAMSVVDK